VKVYLVLVEDRHTGIDVTPFATLEAALDHAKSEVLSFFDDEDEIEWPDDPSEERVSWWVSCSPESDYVSLISREMHS
jgi:hypothetical protein